jgi:disease resistance protein RPS2
VLPNLQNLEVIEVVNCNKMETMIAEGGGRIMSEESSFSISNTSAVSSTDISLPKLKLLTLICLPELQIICNDVMICSSLEEINAVDCLKLKTIPISLPLPCLQKIKVKAYPKKWWESVEWRY